MSYNGVGLWTPRGSGTNGYVTKNLSALQMIRRPMFKIEDYEKLKQPPPARKPNTEILLHQAKRKVEIKVQELAEDMRSRGESADLIESKTSELRERLLKRVSIEINADDAADLKDTHRISAAKEDELKRLADAFGIKDAVEGKGFQVLEENVRRKKEIELHKIALGAGMTDEAAKAFVGMIQPKSEEERKKAAEDFKRTAERLPRAWLDRVPEKEGDRGYGSDEEGDEGRKKFKEAQRKSQMDNYTKRGFKRSSRERERERERSKSAERSSRRRRSRSRSKGRSDRYRPRRSRSRSRSRDRRRDRDRDSDRRKDDDKSSSSRRRSRSRSRGRDRDRGRSRDKSKEKAKQKNKDRETSSGYKDHDKPKDKEKDTDMQTTSSSNATPTDPDPSKELDTRSRSRSRSRSPDRRKQKKSKDRDSDKGSSSSHKKSKSKSKSKSRDRSRSKSPAKDKESSKKKGSRSGSDSDDSDSDKD